MAASFLSASSPVATLPYAPNKSMSRLGSLSSIGGGGVRIVPKISISGASRRLSLTPSYSRTSISCSIAQPETLKTVQDIIAKQLSIDEATVAPETKFSDLGADSLDTVEIMMALEETFGVSVGEGGAENIATVQDAADLIEKVKTASS